MFESLLNLIAPFMVALSLTGVTGAVESSCIPPIPSKPQSEVRSNDFGTMTITPEISEAHAPTSGSRREKDGIKESEITIAVVPNVNARSIIITDGPFFSRADLIDWGPSDQPQKIDFVYNSSNGSLRFAPITTWWQRLRKVETTLPAHERYWVKLRVSPTASKNPQSNAGPYGWSSISYHIDDHTQWKSGKDVYLVKDPPIPGMKSICDSSRTKAAELKAPVEPPRDLKTTPAPTPNDRPPSPIPPPPAQTRPVTPPQSNTGRSSSVSIKSFVINQNRSLEGLVEGDIITFTAVLIMSDGTQIPTGATDKITWSVVGDIGTISANGSFKAKLDPSILEIGEGIGAVTALYVDKQGNPFLGKTQTFKVKAVFLDNGATQG